MYPEGRSWMIKTEPENLLQNMRKGQNICHKTYEKLGKFSKSMEKYLAHFLNLLIGNK